MWDNLLRLAGNWPPMFANILSSLHTLFAARPNSNWIGSSLSYHLALDLGQSCFQYQGELNIWHQVSKNTAEQIISWDRNKGRNCGLISLDVSKSRLKFAIIFWIDTNLAEIDKKFDKIRTKNGVWIDQKWNKYRSKKWRVARKWIRNWQEIT